MSGFNDAIRNFRAVFSAAPAPAPALDLNMVEVDDSTRADPADVHLARWAIERNKRKAEHDEQRRKLSDCTPTPAFRAGHEPQEL